MALSILDCVAFIGLDWADRKHDICLINRSTGERTLSQIEHDPATIHRWANSLKRSFKGKPIAVCLELCRGPIIEVLLQHDHLLIVPVNPQSVAKYRKAFATSGAKDDPTDAALMADLLDRHSDHLTPLKQASDDVRKLRFLVDMRRNAISDRVRISNRLTAALKNYYPQPLQWFTDVDTMVFGRFVRRWPTLQSVQEASENVLLDFFFQNNVRRRKLVDERIQNIAHAVPLSTDNVTIECGAQQVIALADELLLKLEQTQALDEQIASHFSTLADAELFKALPGAGPALAPRLLAAFGDDRQRWPEVKGFLQYTGIAPVTERSGKKCWVHWRYNCPTFVRQTFVEWAAQTIKTSFWARTFYYQQRRKGSSYQAALRALAFKWIRILFRCWQDRKPYDEGLYLLSLQKKGSPLVQGMDQAIQT